MAHEAHDGSPPGSDAAAPSTLTPNSGADSLLDAAAGSTAVGFSPIVTRWMGWRLRLLVACALLGCLSLFLLARSLAGAPHVDAEWRLGNQGLIELAGSDDPALRLWRGSPVLGISGGATHVPLQGALALQRSSRWLIDDDERQRHRTLHEALARALASSAAASAPLLLHLADGNVLEAPVDRRGFDGLPAMFWLLASFALVLYLVAMVVLLARPSGRNLLYALMALCQSGNLVFMAMESTLALGLPGPIPRLDMPLRMAFDLVTAATIVSAAAVHPRQLPGAGWIALGAWAVVGLLLTHAVVGSGAYLWWWVQAVVALLALCAIGLLTWSYQIEPHPFAMVLRRFGIVTVSTWVLLTAALAMANEIPGAHPNIASIGSMIWYVFFASLLLIVPFLSKSQQVMREFALLAAISTVATSLDLLFVAVFSLGQFASLTLSLFISLAVYSGARQWILNQLLGSSMLTTERMFEQLYRIAREVEAHPQRTPVLLQQLLRELFEPLEVGLIDKPTTATRVAGDGSTMLVPVPNLNGGGSTPATSIVVRFAHRGRRLFTQEDARLTDRVVEQLRRAVAFDKAVEQGRSEERLRLAQDLHDDIGARLLTLMYKAQSPEMEDYVRHTLQDLKTLTRGLAASNHRLSHAAAEWKADLTQRLTAAHIALGWVMDFDEDVQLSVVRWSALTRVLRELVSNAIAHAQATRLDIEFSLQDDRLDLTVTDNGVGRNPRAWSHGLGLGGVRKRVKQLGGEVEWSEASPRGISCRVIIRNLSSRH